MTRIAKKTNKPGSVPAPAAVSSPNHKSEPKSPKSNKIAFMLVRPGAKCVGVAGSFNEWKPERTPLMPLGNDRWIGDLELGPGRHEYLFVADGQWLPDPAARETAPNPFGGRNSVVSL